MTNPPLDWLFQEYTGAVPGASALLVRDGVVQLSAAFGLADVERSMPATPATNYRLASVSKQFTAMAALLLVADRRLALDDPLARFFAGAPERWRHVTVQQLLTHTSGLLDYEDLIPPGTVAQLRDRDVGAAETGDDGAQRLVRVERCPERAAHAAHDRALRRAMLAGGRGLDGTLLHQERVGPALLRHGAQRALERRLEPLRRIGEELVRDPEQVK